MSFSTASLGQQHRKSMDISQETIKVLIFLLPGFVFIKIFSFRCFIKTYQTFDYVVDSLIASIVIYAISNYFLTSNSISNLTIEIFTVLFITIVLSLTWSVIISKDWIAKILHPGNVRLSTHSGIFPIKAIEKFKGKWHLIRYSNGKEIVGIIRELNHETNEMLIEKGKMVMKDGKLSKESAWYYSPAGDKVIYIRTLEENDE